MRRLLAALLLALAAPAWAATTWTLIGPRSAKAVCTTGSESAPSSTTSPVEGVLLDSTGSCTVTLAAVTAGQTVSGGSVNVYTWDSSMGFWAVAADISPLSVPSTAARAYSWSFTVAGPRGRFAAVPSGVTISSGNAAVWMTCTDRSGRAN